MSEASPLAGVPTAAEPPRRGMLVRYLMRFDDGEVMRWAFRGLLAGAIIVVGLDVKALYDERAAVRAVPGETIFVEPALPPALRPITQEGPNADPRQTITLDPERLRSALSFELRAEGVMAVEGTIDPGSARRFAAELEQRGEYVKTLSLNSPGGSLDDAMAMAKLARERGLDTDVAEGALCASSCPLIMAGGVVRTAHARSAIGLHQFYAGAEMTTGAAQAMSDAQATTARISRHLSELGVDPALWLHALDTPPQALYYLSVDELSTYRLTTGAAPIASQ